MCRTCRSAGVDRGIRIARQKNVRIKDVSGKRPTRGNIHDDDGLTE